MYKSNYASNSTETYIAERCPMGPISVEHLISGDETWPNPGRTVNSQSNFNNIIISSERYCTLLGNLRAWLIRPLIPKMKFQ